MSNPIHILVAEDDNEINRLLCKIIQKSGYLPSPPIENLLDNAVKYAKGSVEISLAEKSNTVELTIINEAVGLADSEVNRLFDRFYTADRARSAQTSGLGLPIAKSLMTAMRGTIKAELVDSQLKLVCSWRKME